MKRRDVRLILVGILLFQLPGFAQEKIPLFKRCLFQTLNYEQGLLNNATENVITDTLGFTWISTRTGLQRYNGTFFETINPVLENTTVNINGPVYFFLLNDKSIWFSYKQYVLRLNPVTVSFDKIIELHNSEREGILVISVQETEKGVICMVKNKGVILFSKKGKPLRTIFTSDAFTESVFLNSEILTNSNFSANQNSLFIYNGNEGIEQLNFQTKQIHFFHSSENVQSMVCTSGVLYLLSDFSIRAVPLNGGLGGKAISFSSLIKEKVMASAVTIAGNRNVWISLNNHFFELDSNLIYGHEFVSLTRAVFTESGYIRRIYEDSFSRIWLLTNDDIKRIQNIRVPFEHFLYKREKNNFIRSLYYDEKRNFLFAGCFNSGLQLYDTLGNEIWDKPVVTEKFKDINAISKINSGNYFISTIRRGWFIFNFPSQRILPIVSPDSLENIIHSHSLNFINNLQALNDSTLLIATELNVISCEFKNDKINSAKLLLPPDFTKSKVSCFLYQNKDDLCVGCVDGTLFHKDSVSPLQAIYLPGSFQIRSFAADDLHHIWVGTDRGLCVLNSQGNLIKRFTIQNGLLNDCIYAILPIRKQASVFVSSNFGLSRVSLAGDIVNFTKESGLQSNEFNTGAAIESASGKFYFGGVNGISAFYPFDLSELADKPVLNITKFILNDSLLPISSVMKNGTLLLPYDRNRIQFDFAALGMLNTDEYLYSYRLYGLESKWQTTHQPREIKYILPPGDYVFEIKCQPIFSAGAILSKYISIRITPPWWKQWWFRITLIAFLILIIVLIVHQLNRLKFVEQIRKLHVKQEIQQERERISRDLHDNLGAYAAAIESNIVRIERNPAKNISTLLSQLRDNSQSIINQLNDTIWTLNKEEILLTSISDRFKMILQKIRPNYPEIQIQVKEDIQKNYSFSPEHALHLFLILKEAVNNALRHSNCSILKIVILSKVNWSICVSDNGEGVNLKNAVLGNGISNMQKRAKEAGWNICWKPKFPQGMEVFVCNQEPTDTN